VLPELVLDVVIAGLASMGIGLLVSAVVRNADQANFGLPILLVAQMSGVASKRSERSPNEQRGPGGTLGQQLAEQSALVPAI
jgi:hypothetical protein